MEYIVYYYTISLIVITWRYCSKVYIIPKGASKFAPGLKYRLLSLLLGWWGIPWGPIRTVQSVFVNCAGGKNVTALYAEPWPVENPDDFWECPCCYYKNKNTSFECRSCGYKLI